MKILLPAGLPGQLSLNRLVTVNITGLGKAIEKIQKETQKNVNGYRYDLFILFFLYFWKFVENNHWSNFNMFSSGLKIVQIF